MQNQNNFFGLHMMFKMYSIFLQLHQQLLDTSNKSHTNYSWNDYKKNATITGPFKPKPATQGPTIPVLELQNQLNHSHKLWITRWCIIYHCVMPVKQLSHHLLTYYFTFLEQLEQLVVRPKCLFVNEYSVSYMFFLYTGFHLSLRYNLISYVNNFTAGKPALLLR